MWNITGTMTRSLRTCDPHPDINASPPLSAEELRAECLAAEGWPVLRGTAAQRDARFVKKLLKTQLALVRGRT
jgi:hypothetical protein